MQVPKYSILIFMTILLMAFIAGCQEVETVDKYAQFRADIPKGYKPPSPATDWWRPEPGLTWQWQLAGKFDNSIHVDVYDIDIDVHPSVVEYFHKQGIKVICYINVGSWENWRSDAGQFPEEIIGKDYEGWSGEKWLDIRRIDQLAPVMLARFDECAEKGFDAIEPDNIEVYTNDTGFPLTYDDQLRYAIWLADEAHARGLAMGLKNAPDQVKDLVDLFDFAITEDCFFQGWCEQMMPFIQNGKAVFAAEYTDLTKDFSPACKKSKELNFSTILKRRNLGAWVEICE